MTTLVLLIGNIGIENPMKDIFQKRRARNIAAISTILLSE